MAEQIRGRTVFIDKPPIVLYNVFSDLRNLADRIPDDKKDKVKSDADTVTANVKGFEIGIKIKNRVPFSLVEFENYGQAPFPFLFALHLDCAKNGGTDFFIELKAELNIMMKMMIGGKLQEIVDKITDQIASIADGKIPPGMDGYVS